MAITSAQLQAEFGSHALDAKVTRELGPFGSTKQYWWVEGLGDFAGRSRPVETTASDNAATQAAAVTTQMNA